MLRLRDRTDRVVSGVIATLGIAVAIMSVLERHWIFAALTGALGLGVLLVIARDHRARRSTDHRPDRTG